jgi:hypothetical protein
MPDTKPQEVHENVLRDMAAGKTIPTASGAWQVAWMAKEILRLRYVSEAAPKVRRMKSNAMCQDSMLHSITEHDETESCRIEPPCQPVEAEQPAAPCSNCGELAGDDECRKYCDLIAPDPGDGWRLLGLGEKLKEGDQYVARGRTDWICMDKSYKGMEQKWPNLIYRRRVEPAPVQPDPGEGWRLLQSGETIQRDDEVFGGTMWWKVGGAVGRHLKESRVGKYRRRVEPQAKGWEDYELFDDEPLLAFKDRSGETWYAYQAVSLRGFMGFRYEYPNGEYDLFPEPCRKGGEDMDYNMWFPVAVRFSKGKP